MRFSPLVVWVLVNVLVVGLGGVLAFSDLNLRAYSTNSHSVTRVVSVEYRLLWYRPTYQYYDRSPDQVVITQGSWSFDYLQLAILVMLVYDIRWIYNNKKILS